jgi:hypothetical protein
MDKMHSKDIATILLWTESIIEFDDDDDDDDDTVYCTK